MSISNANLTTVVKSLTGGSACMFDHDSDGDLRITVLGAVQGPDGLIGTKDEFEDEEQEEPRTITVSGTVEIEWRVEVEEDPNQRIEDVDAFATDVAEAIRFDTDLVSTVDVDGYHIDAEWDGSDVRNVDWDAE